MNMTSFQFGYSCIARRVLMLSNRTLMLIPMALVIAIVFFTIQDSTNNHQQWSDWSHNISLNTQGTVNHTIDDQIQKPVLVEGRVELDEKVIPPFLPNQILNQYKKWHNNDVLDMELNRMKHYNNESIDRKFSIVYYWCPDRAGNIFHNMFNTIAWSIITNRTILLLFDNTSATGNTEETCDAILHLSSWIPRYNDWYIPYKLNTTKIDRPIAIPIDSEQYQLTNGHRTVIFPQIPDIRFNDGRDIFYRNSWRDHPLDLPEYVQYIKKMDEWNQLIAKNLYYEGVDFLFGMIFREIFILNQKLINQTTEMIPQNFLFSSTNNNNIFSMALHSRHTVVGDEGNYIHEEIQCLNNTLPPQEDRTLDSCFIILMSDRILTVDLISKWLIENNCTPVSGVATNNELMPEDKDIPISSLRNTEHGSRAGVGFIEDLILTSHARNGFIGDVHRSSFMLVVELISYDRKIDAWKKNISIKDNSDIVLPELLTCPVKDRPVGGYSYGPGTPTFRHHTRQKPLQSIEIFNQYKNWHGFFDLNTSNSELRDDSNETVISLRWNNDNVYTFLNRLLWAIVSNHTIFCMKCSDINETEQPMMSLIGCNENTSILTVPDWIPSYDRGETIRSPDEATRSNSDYNLMIIFDNRTRLYNDSNDIITSMIPEWSYPMDFSSPDTYLNQSSICDLISNLTWSKESIPKLLDQGSNFLYGMLFHQTLSLTPIESKITFSTSSITEVKHSSGTDFTLALDFDDSQSNELDLSKCVEPMLESAMNLTCHVYILRDSKRLSFHDWIPLKNCIIHYPRRIIVSNISTLLSNDTKNIVELYSNFNWVSDKTRSAFIGYKNDTISNLLFDSIEYKRRMEIWKRGRDPPDIPVLQKCFLT